MPLLPMVNPIFCYCIFDSDRNDNCEYDLYWVKQKREARERMTGCVATNCTNQQPVPTPESTRMDGLGGRSTSTIVFCVVAVRKEKKSIEHDHDYLSRLPTPNSPTPKTKTALGTFIFCPVTLSIDISRCFTWYIHVIIWHHNLMGKFAPQSHFIYALPFTDFSVWN